MQAEQSNTILRAEGYTTYNPYSSSVPEFESEYTQEFEFDAEGLGNMMSKISTETVTPQKSIGDNLNYSFNYVYDKNYAHRLLSAGDRYYQYDSNGNVICEQDGSFEEEEIEYHKSTEEAEGVYSSDYAWAYFNDDNKNGKGKSRYHRTYTWDEKNRLINSTDSSYNTSYVYGQDGQRSNKYTQSSETLYFNKMWTFHTDSGNSVYGGQTAKNIYLGETRIVTKLNSGTEPTYQEEYYKQYYYHSDHLGSASLISDSEGNEYQRIEYTPYGETWVEKTNNTGLEFLPYKFTAKELDEETGLYYYGARYLDPKYSRWISTDPALGDYIPQAPVSDEARKHNQNLPGMGGIFNPINSDLYDYGANNPVHYIDPTGTDITIPNIANAIKNLTLIQKATRDIPMYQYEAGGNFNLPGTGKSWCNQSTFDVMIATGFNTKGVFEAKGRYETTANQAVSNLEKLASNRKNSGIYEVTPKVAQKLANLGVTVVCAWNGGNDKGHLSTVVPESKTTLSYSDTEGPVISNVGGTVGIMSTKSGFWRADNAGGWKNTVKFYVDSNQFVKFDTSKVLQEFLK